MSRGGEMGVFAGPVLVAVVAEVVPPVGAEVVPPVVAEVVPPVGTAGGLVVDGTERQVGPGGT